MRDFWQAISFGGKNKKLLYFLVFISLAISVVQIISPIVLKQFFDLIDKSLRTGTQQVSFTALYKYTLIYLVISVLGILLYELNRYYGNKYRTGSINSLFLESLHKAEELSLSYYEETGTGKILERINQGTEDAVNISFNFFTFILPQLLFVILATYLLFRIMPVFGLIIVVGVPIYVLIMLLVSKRLHIIQKDVRKFTENSRNEFVETVSNVKTVKTFGKENYHFQKMAKALEKVYDLTVKRAVVRAEMAVGRGSVMVISQSLVLFIGVYLTLTGKITLGTLILAWSYTNQSFGPMAYIVSMIDDIQRDIVSVHRLGEFLQTKPEITDRPNAIEIRKIKGNIELKNLSFKYKEEKELVLKNLSLKVNHGEVLALVGRSGEGKSTIVKLLLRFYEPEKGEIEIDGNNINKITQKSLRDNIGVVMQDSIIFNDTVMNNIKYGNQKAQKEDVIKAAKLANAHDFIMNLPEQYNTIVGERGVKLSGGEQQRINIARVILKNPPIIVLDEATSSLDSESEKLIQDALWKLIQGKTTVIIAHRLSTVMRSDLIAVLDKGKIVEIDTHNNLVKKGGIYSKLFKIQSGGYLS